MNIEMRIENKVVTILLLKDSLIVDKIMMGEEHRLSEDLLPGIEKLLVDNGLAPEDISEMMLNSDMGDNFTTQRIALTVMQAFNWGNAVDN